MKIKVMGLGWYGEPLATELVKLGHEVSGTTRSEDKIPALKAKGIEAHVLSYPDTQTVDADLVVLNIPPFEDELNWFKSWKWNVPWIIFISSTGTPPLLLEQEKWISSTFPQWTILRFGGLFGGGRHPGKHLSGKQNVKGANWPVNLIHQDDTVGATLSVIEKKVQHKIINVVSSDHPSKKEYYESWCRMHNLPLPHFDESDVSVKEAVDNRELREFYTPRRDLFS